ncbi:hypothetical protein WJX84_000502 [Apatococcus fuscideae]|uniref:Helicase ATP-binding domain-containing protein n=1 Tax=Apatococcus fuscideae TaxID=2026836 RepID=A0AAW1S1A9_9CHLO
MSASRGNSSSVVDLTEDEDLLEDLSWLTGSARLQQQNGGQPASGQPGSAQQGGAGEMEEDEASCEGNEAAASQAAATGHLEAVLEGLQHQEATVEREPPPGTLTVTLHAYQKRALAWMLYREENARGVRGGILADEMGLGKTVQMLAVIVSSVCSRREAEVALNRATREQNNAELHVLGSEARRLRLEAAEEARRRQEGGPDFGPSQSAMKKARRIVWQPCGAGPNCTCAVCKKAGKQQARVDLKEEQKREKERKISKKRDKQAVQSSGPVREMGIVPTKPTVESPDGGIAKRTLVICPLSVASQWVDEVKAKTPQLSVVLYHGGQRAERFPPTMLSSMDVVVSTYDVLVSEKNVTPEGPLFRVQWHRVILDEAHIIRNRSRLAPKACGALQAQRRWCLTGTPIINSADDTFSLFSFLRHRPFCDFSIFTSQIRSRLGTVSKKQNQPSLQERKEGFRELRIALQSITMRRLKSDKINGRPIITLPPKTIEIRELEFTPEEMDFYESMEKQSQARFLKYVRQNFRQNYHHILVLLLRLRQACVHPYLAQTKDDGSGSLPSDEQAPREDAEGNSGLDPDVKKKLVAKLKELASEECFMCCDAPQPPVITRCCHGPACKDCWTRTLEASVMT